MDGLEYEDECADYLAGLGFTHIERTVVTGDQGVDIIAQKDGELYAFQCKYYSTPVGNYAVQEVYAGCAFYDCDVPVVISNTTFTRGAIELADKIGVELWPDTGGREELPNIWHMLYIMLHVLMLGATAAMLGVELYGDSQALSGGISLVEYLGRSAFFLLVIKYAAGIAAPLAAFIRRTATLELSAFCYAVTCLIYIGGYGYLGYAGARTATEGMILACALSLAAVLVKCVKIRIDMRRN